MGYYTVFVRCYRCFFFRERESERVIERERVDRESDRERERFSQISKIVKIVKKDNTFIIIIVIC